MRVSLSGGVLPTVVVVSVLMLVALLGLLTLWEHESLLFARAARLRQARADVASAYTLYRLQADAQALTDSTGYRLYDSLPRACVHVAVRPWGLYEAVEVCSADSLVHTCRLMGVEAPAAQTLYYADNRAAVTLAGQTVLQGTLSLPQNGLIYGRVGSDFYHGTQIPRTAIQRAERALPELFSTSAASSHVPSGQHHLAQLFAAPDTLPAASLGPDAAFPDSLTHSFLSGEPLVLRLQNAEIGDCQLRGRILLYADELRIDSTCRIEHLVVCARKIVVGRGARITAQLFARDTLLIEPRAVLEHPSGIYAQQYAELGARACVDGYAIVCDTTTRDKLSANYRQARTARLRGLLYVDGIAQVQGIVSGRAVVRQAAYFSPQGYYKDMLYDVTILENPATVQPLWLAATRRKEVLCVD